MNYDSFLECLTKGVSERMGDGIHVRPQKVKKNNSTEVDAIMIVRDDSNISPTVYTKYFWERYERGASMEDLIEEVVSTYNDNAVCEDFDLNTFLDFEQVKDRVVYKVINYEKNKELLENVPHYRYLDLAVVFYYLLSSEKCLNATILIHKSHMKTWNVTERDLLSKAAVNSPKLLRPSFRNIYNYLQHLAFPPFPVQVGEEEAEKMFPMYVLSNHTGVYGSGAILYRGLLQEISRKVGGDFYLLPSSVHEVIILSDLAGNSIDAYKQIVKEVNGNDVAEEEVLSDSVYRYSAAQDELTVVG